MAGIIFFGTTSLEEIQAFYISEIGAKLWLDQGDCVILRHENMLFGFCEREKLEKCGTITFFYDSKDKVDEMYKRMEEKAIDQPKKNDAYDIYNFFARDPEGRRIEFQCFLHEIQKPWE